MKGTWEIVLSGVGGQGLLSIGNLLGEAASIFGGKKATMTASYGVETRGTFTKSDVIISDEEIDFPEVLNPDIVLCLAQMSYDLCCCASPSPCSSPSSSPSSCTSSSASPTPRPRWPPA